MVNNIINVQAYSSLPCKFDRGEFLFLISQQSCSITVTEILVKNLNTNSDVTKFQMLGIRECLTRLLCMTHIIWMLFIKTKWTCQGQHGTFCLKNISLLISHGFSAKLYLLSTQVLLQFPSFLLLFILMPFLIYVKFIFAYI